MSLKLERKGYTLENLRCPNCDGILTLFFDDKRTLRKTVFAKLLEDGKIKCDYCESILSYQPK
jgi:hypothetical protein